MELDEFIEFVKEQQGIDLSGVLTTADQIARPQSSLDRDAFDDFNVRNPMAGGGMLVQPSADGSRPGYAVSKGKTKKKTIDKKRLKVFNQYSQELFGENYEKLTKPDDVAKVYNTAVNRNKGKDTFEYRESQRAPLPKKQKNKLIKFAEANNIKLDFDNYPKFGVPRSIDGKPGMNPDYQKIFDSYKNYDFKIFKNIKEGTLLNLEQRAIVMDNFELPQGVKNWNFDKFKFGINSTKYRNLQKRIERKLDGPVKYTIAADRGSAKGWMMAAMERAYKNQTTLLEDGTRILKKGVDALTYEPIFKEGTNIIIGFKDNTPSGQGLTYYGLNKNTPDGAASWSKHKDYNKVAKFLDITERVKQEPDAILQKILDEKGITKLLENKGTQLNLNDILSHERYYDKLSTVTKPKLIEKQIVRHHISGVGAGDVARANATKDIQLLTGAVNNKVREFETKLLEDGFLSKADNQELKDLGAKIRGADGKIYGGGYVNPERQFDLIRDRAMEYAKSDKFTVRTVESYLAKIGCPGKGKAYGGRVQFQDGLSPEVCMTRGAQVIKEKRIDSPAQKANFNKMMKVASVGKNMALLKDALGPYGLGGDVLLEGMIAVNKTLTGGTPFKESWQDSWLSNIVGGAYDEKGQKLGRQKLFELRSGLSSGAQEFGDYNRKVEEYYKLIEQRNNLEALSGGSDFDYVGDLSSDVRQINNKIKVAERELGRMETRINAQGGFEAAQNEFNRKTTERQDADAATSLQSIGRRFVEDNQLNQMLQDDFSDLSSDALPPQRPDRTPLTSYIDFKPDLPTLDEYKKAYGDLAKEFNITPPNEQQMQQEINQEKFRQLFNQPGFMGASDTFFGDSINMAKGGRAGFMAGTIPGGYGKQANRYLKEIESDMHKGYQYYKKHGGKKSFKQYMRESMSKYFADGGIAGLSGGVKSGPPPESGPNSQGLQGLMKRVKNI